MLNALRTLIKLKAPWNDAQKIQVLAWLDAAEDFGENLDKCAEKLEEAKKIIRECMGQMTFHDCEYTDAYKKAEAFLKGCENACVYTRRKRTDYQYEDNN